MKMISRVHAIWYVEYTAHRVLPLVSPTKYVSIWRQGVSEPELICSCLNKRIEKIANKSKIFWNFCTMNMNKCSSCIAKISKKGHTFKFLKFLYNEYVVVCSKKTNRSDVSNKSWCFKHHHILSFCIEHYICIFLVIFGAHLEHVFMFIVQNFRFFFNLVAMSLGS
jgi:hypothetical protein